jgi:hypothetical protein
MSPLFWSRPTDESNIAKAMPGARTCEHAGDPGGAPQTDRMTI